MQYLTFKYKNWKGQVGIRKVIPAKMWYGKTKYHPKPQWLLKAYDIDKQAHRDFALNDIIEWGDKETDLDVDTGCVIIETEENTQ